MHTRSNVENQILKAGFTSREIVIMENDDPGGVFEFSQFSRGPWFINVSQSLTFSKLFHHPVSQCITDIFIGLLGVELKKM